MLIGCGRDAYRDADGNAFRKGEGGDAYWDAYRGRQGCLSGCQEEGGGMPRGRLSEAGGMLARMPVGRGRDTYRDAYEKTDGWGCP